VMGISILGLLAPAGWILLIAAPRNVRAMNSWQSSRVVWWGRAGPL